MIENTKDIFYIVASFSILWVAIFLSWFLYYLGQTIKHVNKIVVEAEEKLHSVLAAVDFIRDKIGMLASAVGFLVQGFMGREKEKKETRGMGTKKNKNK